MKTPEEAAREYAKKIWKNGRTYRSRIGYSAEDFLAGYASAMAKVGEAPKWISVEDKLPVIGKNGISDMFLCLMVATTVHHIAKINIIHRGHGLIQRWIYR